MQCVILAAGEGRRMRPLTLVTPKPLLEVGGRPILEHVIAALPPEISELTVVIGYLGEQIRAFLGENFRGRPVTYVWQRDARGTAHALQLCRPQLGGERFLLTCADDLHDPEAIRACLDQERSLLIAEHPEAERFGVVTLRPDGTVAEIMEKPKQPASRLVSTGVMVLDRNIFRYEPDRHENGEYYLTSMLSKMLADHRVSAVRAGHWFPIASPGDLALAGAFLERLEQRRRERGHRRC